MRIGIPREIKPFENRVGMAPDGVRELTRRGHQVLLEAGAGVNSGFEDERYAFAGARIVASAQEVFQLAELLVKVKEPQPSEFPLLRDGQLLFTFLHLAPDDEQVRALLARGVTGIAYETVRDARGQLPLLAPMSEVAGRLSVQAGAHCLEKAQGGSGVLLGGVPGVNAGKVLVLGGGVAGLNAARVALGMGARVVIVDRSIDRLRHIDELYRGGLATLYSTADTLERELRDTDLVIGAVLVPGAEAPRLITRDMLALLKPGSVLVDVSIDQGGCFETSRPTTHHAPSYVVDGIVHYAVANIPSAVARTATKALTSATLPYVIALAEKGFPDALLADPGFLQGLNVHRGQVTCAAVAQAQGLPSVAPEKALRD